MKEAKESLGGERRESSIEKMRESKIEKQGFVLR